MKKANRLAWLGLAVWLVITAPVFATGALPAQAAAPATQGIDVVVLLDDSGSMATCWPWVGPPLATNCLGAQNPPSDPHDLRYSAVRLLVLLAGSKDRVAVVRFNAGTEGVIGQLQQAGNPDARQALTDALRPPTDYVTTGGYTRIDLALNHAKDLLTASKDQGRPSYVLLLTDGVPSQPGNVPGQEKPVQATMAALTQLGTQVFPVELCNDKAGCPDDTFITHTMGRVPDKAKTAGDLLRVFSSIFAQMEPDLHVVDQGNSGALEFNIRPEHGARRLVIVADKSGLQAVKRDDNPEAVSSAYQDDNILLNVVGDKALAPGKWTVETNGHDTFAVVQTDTYPELTFPPASVPGSSAAPYYVPAGKPVAILARVAGPGAGTPVRLGDGTALKPYSPGDGLLWTVLPGANDGFTLQVGDDQAPLQIVRRFRLQARSDLPTALIISPSAASPCSSNKPCPLKVAFGPGLEVSETQGAVYVSDESAGGKLAYSTPMVCTGRTCADAAANFQRLDGHRYTIRFFVQARAAGALYGDWAETTLAVGSSVGLRGLPAVLNLKTQPAGGWPVTVTVGTTEDLGQLRATIALTRTDDNTPVSDAQVSFAAGLVAAGEQATALRVVTPPGLRPGHYEGKIAFAVDKTPAGEQVTLPAPLPLSLTLTRPAVELSDHSIDFGNVLFDTSPNFRINQVASIGVVFAEAPFSIVPAMVETTCPALSVVAGAPEQAANGYRVPVTLTSSGSISPQTCSGTLSFAGPSEDYAVQGNPALPWRVTIPQVDWQLVGVERAGGPAGDLDFGSLGRPGERSSATLLVRYTGQPPFSLVLLDLQGKAGTSNIEVGAQDVELATAGVAAQPGSPGLYRVPVELVVRRSLPHATSLAGWLAGTDYSGQLRLDIAGLPSPNPREANFRFHNPGNYQRYIAPFYRWWWPGLLTCPLSILLPLALLGFVWLRKKDADVERILAHDRATASAPVTEGANTTPPARVAGSPADAAPGHKAPGPAYMLYGRPSANNHQVPQRAPRPAEKPAQGGPSSAGSASPGQAGSGVRPSVPPASLPPRPLRRSGPRWTK